MNEKELKGISDLKYLFTVNLEFLPRHAKRMSREELNTELSKYKKGLKAQISNILCVIVVGAPVFDTDEVEYGISASIVTAKYYKKAIKIIKLELAKRAA